MKTAKIFPRRFTRRDFVKMAGLATAGLSFPTATRGIEPKSTIRLGSGYHTYELVENWGVIPDGAKYGFGCGIVADSKDRIYVLTRTKPGLMIFDRAGNLLESWEEEAALKKGISADTFTHSAHGLYWSKEQGQEYLYFTENKPGCRMTKTDLKGNILLRIGQVNEETPTSIKFTFDNPTDVAIGPNGDIYVVDGYGSQLVHRFSKDGKLIRTIGGPGKENGKFNICHGIWLNTLKKEPEIY
ncbi:MAG: twin-arginine translocation signal domain-containing protein, partial [Verrucomicrobiota bacterium]|nr:twin-arginine translocation signal domain-containing protein [Verrucomicrobiota bacterium]